MNKERLSAFILSALTNSPFNSDLLLKNLRLYNTTAFLNNKNPKNEIILQYTHQILTKNISKIDPSSQKLIIDALLDFNWAFFAQSPSVLHSYSQLLLHLSTRHFSLLPRVLKKLLEIFRLKFLDAKETSLDDREKIFSVVHFLIGSLFKNVSFPTSSAIQSLLSSCSPFIRLSVEENNFLSLELYLCNILKIAEYSSVDLGTVETVLFTVIQKLVEMEIHVHILQRDDSSNIDKSLLSYFSDFKDKLQIDIKRNLSIDTKLENIERIGNKLTKPNGKILETLKSVDRVLFNILTLIKSRNSIIKNSLLHCFQQILIPSSNFNGTLHTNFTILYASSLDPNFLNSVLSILRGKLGDSRESYQTRSICASYLAGLLVHSSLIRTLVCVDLIEEFVQFAIQLIKDLEPFGMITPETAEYPPYRFFYAVCNSIFYVTTHCYHLLCASEYSEQLGVFLEKIVHSKINPLQFCAKGVVADFCILMEKVQLLNNCFSILCCNKKYFCSSNKRNIAKGLDSVSQFNPPFREFFLEKSAVFFKSKIISFDRMCEGLNWCVERYGNTAMEDEQEFYRIGEENEYVQEDEDIFI